jgi:hypothetical protein
VQTLRDKVQDEIDRAVTHAFSGSFVAAGLLALASLIPLIRGRRPEL